MNQLIAFLLLLLSQAAYHAAPPPIIHQAAGVAAAEAPISLVGIEAYVGVLCTMRNRLDSPRYPNTIEAMLDAYHAPFQEPTEQEFAIALDALTQPDACDWGALRIYYAMSQQDVDRHGFPDGDLVSPARVLPSGTVMRVHFYTDYPEATQ